MNSTCIRPDTPTVRRRRARGLRRSNANLTGIRSGAISTGQRRISRIVETLETLRPMSGSRRLADRDRAARRSRASRISGLATRDGKRVSERRSSPPRRAQTCPSENSPSSTMTVCFGTCARRRTAMARSRSP